MLKGHTHYYSDNCIQENYKENKENTDHIFQDCRHLEGEESQHSCGFGNVLFLDFDEFREMLASNNS
jgi:hypothetical protein